MKVAGLANDLEGRRNMRPKLLFVFARSLRLLLAQPRSFMRNDPALVAPKTSATGESPDKSPDCDWSKGSFEELRELIAALVPESIFRYAATKSLDPTKVLEGEKNMSLARATHSESPELKPMENIWQFKRDNWLSNRVYSCSGMDLPILSSKS